MTTRTRLSLRVLGAAVVLGVFGDALLRATPWGLNVLLWTELLVAGVLLLAYFQRCDLRVHAHLTALPILFFAATFAWRDSPTLRLLNLMGLFAALALALLSARTGSVRLVGVFHYLAGGLLTGFVSAVGAAPLVTGDITWRELSGGGWTGHAKAVARGLGIALPLLLVFGGLFVSADAVFQDILASAFGFDVGATFGHAAVAIGIAWLCGGYLREVLLGGARPLTFDAALPRPALGAVELATSLGLLDLLFAGFVAVQIRYLFGGASLADATPGLTYAEYARRGFFELVAVAALSLVVLLAAHWLVERSTEPAKRLYVALAGVQIVTVFVIMASAYRRMRMYQAGYGMTELRFYTVAFMAWIAVLFVWFAWTVLRGKREGFAFGALASGLAAILVLNGVNPDARIAATNTARASAGLSFDAAYTASLSADAVPVLVDALPTLPPSARAIVAHRLLVSWTPPDHLDFRTWSASRAAAWSAVGLERRAIATAAVFTQNNGEATPGTSIASSESVRAAAPVW
jgi:hypothetical protein